MKILALEIDIPGVNADQFTPHLKRAEAMRVWELYQEGIFRELYFRQDVSNGVLIMECPDLETAREILDTLPLVKAGLIAFDLIPLIPYPGFSRLFFSQAPPGEKPQ